MSPSLRVTGLQALVTRVQGRLAAATPDQAPALAAELGQTVARLEARLAALGGTPADLPEPTRRALAWLRHLSEPTGVVQHLAALARAGQAARALVPGLEVTVTLANQAAVWRGQRQGKRRTLVVHEAFAGADDAGWRALLAAALLGDAHARDAVRRVTEGQAYRQALRALEPEAQAPAATDAHVHDLEAAFRRVNARYFDGSLPHPAQLQWTARRTWRRFGTYEPARDRVTISASLDDAAVPAWVVEGVLHHELLHKALGFTDRGLTRGAHTTAFRTAEARFERAAELDTFLADLARRGRRRSGR